MKRERVKREILFFVFSSLRLFLKSMEIGPWDFIRAIGKVYPRIENYIWALKSWSFAKLHEVGNFLTCVISNLKAI